MDNEYTGVEALSMTWQNRTEQSRADWQRIYLALWWWLFCRCLSVSCSLLGCGIETFFYISFSSCAFPHRDTVVVPILCGKLNVLSLRAAFFSFLKTLKFIWSKQIIFSSIVDSILWTLVNSFPFFSFISTLFRLMLSIFFSLLFFLVIV